MAYSSIVDGFDWHLKQRNHLNMEYYNPNYHILGCYF